MKDPHIAADGFTYEAEAIKEWFDSGQDVSPMTNQKLAHRELIPNWALRSAILEWANELRLCKFGTVASRKK
jgi:U-box domain